MNSKTPVYMFIVSVVVAVGMLVFAVNRSGSKAGELLGTQQAQDIAALQQSIFDLQQTVKKQSRVIEQLNVQGGVVQGLLQHKLQHVLKRHRVGRIVEIANAPKSFGHVFLNAHADDKGFHHNAFGLQGATHGTGIFIASFDAVRDEDDHVATWRVGKIVRGLFERPGNRRGALCTDASEGLFDDEVVRPSEGHHELGVVAILVAGNVLRSVPIDAKPQFELVPLVEFLECFAEEVGRGFNFSMPTPKRIHAVGGIKDEENACGKRFALDLDLALAFKRAQRQEATQKELTPRRGERGLKGNHVRKRISNPPTSIQAGSVRRPAGRHLAQCRATCACLP